jgi:hypothetical protein
MSDPINSVKNAPGFDLQLYETLLQEAKSQGVSTSQVDTLLLAAVNSGQDFDAAVDQVQKSLPKLSPPNGVDLARISEFGGVPSPGALVMSLITKMAGEQRERNMEERHKSTEALVDSMMDQAEEMRDAANIQFAMTVVSGVITIAGGLAQVGMAGSAMRSGLTDGQIGARNAMGSGISGAAGGFAGIAKGIGDFNSARSQALCKEMEADQEKMHAMRDSMKELDDSMRDLIQKTLSAQDAIQQAENQARAKILG